MKRALISAMMLIGVAVWGATINLTNDTVWVGTPTGANSPVPSGYLATNSVNGTNITDSTISSNKFDAATRAALGTGSGAQTQVLGVAWADSAGVANSATGLASWVGLPEAATNFVQAAQTNGGGGGTVTYSPVAGIASNLTEATSNLFAKSTEKYILLNRDGTSLGNSYGLDNFTLVQDNNIIKVADRIEQKADLALFWRATDRSQTAYGLLNTWLDVFADQVGIDSTRSTGELYDSSGFYWNMGATGIAPGKCLTFDGSDDYVVCGNTNFWGPGDATASYSVSFWFTNNADTAFILMACFNPGVANMIEISYGWQTTYWDFRQGASAFTKQLPNPATLTGWHHIVMTGTNQTVNVYFDAVQIGTNQTLGTYTPIASTVTAFGGYSGQGSAHFNGKIDEIVTWNYVIDQTKVTALYNGGIGTYTTTNAGETHIFHIDDNTGTTSIDQCTTNLLTFGGAPSWTVSPIAAQITSTAATNMNLYSTNFPVVTVPTNFRVVAYLENVSNAVLNTDFFLGATRDGTNWYTPTLTSDGYYSNSAYVVSGTGTFSAAAHTNVGIRAVATNNSVVKIHGWHVAVE